MSKPEILEESETLELQRILTIRSGRGEEMIVNADELAKAFVTFRSDLANEKRFGWQLNKSWWADQFDSLCLAARKGTP